MPGITGRNQGRRFALLAVVVAAGFLGGCKDGETGRKLHLQKGVYDGAADTALPAETRIALKDRVALQRGGQPELHQPLAPAVAPGVSTDAAVEGRIRNQRF